MPFPFSCLKIEKEVISSESNDENDNEVFARKADGREETFG
jgi:hypothetical protein